MYFSMALEDEFLFLFQIVRFFELGLRILSGILELRSGFAFSSHIYDQAPGLTFAFIFVCAKFYTPPFIRNDVESYLIRLHLT